jgi:hypothetical protein
MEGSPATRNVKLEKHRSLSKRILKDDRLPDRRSKRRRHFAVTR